MRYKYSDETINKLVRTALSFEKQNKFTEALSIYYDLAAEKNEFALERIPLVKYREEQYRLRKVNLFIGIISIFTILTALTTVAYNTVSHIVRTDYITNDADNTYLSKTLNSQNDSKVNLDSISIKYHTVDNITQDILSSTFEIFIPANITSSKLNRRVIEGLESYLPESVYNKNELIIVIKTNSTNEVAGYIKYDNNNTCDVYLVK